ncbi:TPD1 protein homolog 1-like [Vicia villosa]|uniref:TPD1 protein homolog 1-like n=1 Tax=Vicia villosa TaxID=3911 RepID=UPI00273C5B2E|nr:TPD1 protein homolog 1-like [Vicia villosa]
MNFVILGFLMIAVLIPTNVVGRDLYETSSISKTASVSSHLDENCGKSSIQINQSPTEPLPSGIPTYTVEIANTCVSGCSISNVHVACGMFSSATLINPNTFKRLSNNDCLVNGGNTIPNGGVISFKYANTYSYPLSVSSVDCS